MVHKSVAAGVGLIAAVSGPTALAVRRAEALGLALAGFVRGTDGVAAHFRRYWAPSLRERLLAQAQVPGDRNALHPLVRAALLERPAAH